MYNFMTIVFVLACLALIISVIMQSGKAAGLSGSIGGGAEQVFGAKKGEKFDQIFDKATKISAIIFMVSALALVALR